MSQGAQADCDGGGKREAERGASRPAALGYSNTRDALDRHVDPEDKNTVVNPDGNRGNPNMVIINESGLYSQARKRAGGSYR